MSGACDSASPVRKRPRLAEPEPEPASLGKRPGEEGGVMEGIKRLRVSAPGAGGAGDAATAAAQRRKNFVWACLAASGARHRDPAHRFLRPLPPRCARAPACPHRRAHHQEIYREIPEHAKEGFKIDLKARTWTDALYTCRLTMSHKHFLPADILQDILEIILNAHDDSYAGYSITFLMDNCLQILTLMYNTHPPCLANNIRKCYKQFLTGPLLKENSFSNRAEFEYNKGIVKYCMNRLEFELRSDTIDDPIVNKTENIPEQMSEGVKGLHWQKENLDIFETLDRTERIKRLLIVLENIVELLLCDLAIWHARHTHNQGQHIMRSHKPLLAFVLWSDNVLYTGAINNNCRQIISLFVDFVHLGFPEESIKTMTLWLNAMVQTFYICETNSDKDYPNIGKYCTHFAGDFFKIIKDLPTQAVINILKRIQPSFMRSLVGLQCLKSILLVKDDDVLKITLEFLQERKWNEFHSIKSDDQTLKSQNIKASKKCTRIYAGFSKMVRASNAVMDTEDVNLKKCYPKHTKCEITENTVSREQIIEILFLTMHAHIDAHGIDNVQEKWDEMNSQLLCEQNKENDYQDKYQNLSYTVSEHFVKKYRSIYQTLKQIVGVFSELKNDTAYEQFKMFEDISMLGLK